MNCPFCGSENYSCIDSRPQLTCRRRRYECGNCGKRFNTTETVDRKGFPCKKVVPKTLDPKSLKRCYERENYEAATGVKEAFNHCGHAVEFEGKDYCPLKGRIPGYFMVCANTQKIIME